jgi:hypothetical protein
LKSKKEQTDPITSEVRKLMEVSRHFMPRRWTVSGCNDTKLQRKILLDRATLGPCISALMQLDSAFDDCDCAFSLVKRLNWSKALPKYSVRLRLFWVSFLNSCYMYSEKIKLVADQCKSADTILGNPELISSFASHVKNATKILRPFIRERGEIVHSWHKDHRAIEFLGMVEIISDSNALNKKNDGKGINNVRGHFVDTRHEVLNDMTQGLSKLRSFHDPLLRQTAEALTEAIIKFNENVRVAEAMGMTIEEGMS